MSLYHGCQVQFLTQHDKGRHVQTALASLGIAISETQVMDTDSLGTFSRSVPRPLGQLDTATKKARLAADLTGHAYGLGSEGRFDTSETLGMGAMNQEILVWYDRGRDLVIPATATRWVPLQTQTLDSPSALLSFAHQQGFPDQGLLLRPDNADQPNYVLNATTSDELIAQFEQQLAASRNQQVFVEFDGRAHRCPERQRTLQLAAEDLANRLNTQCDNCDLPGVGLHHADPGLPCRQCQMPTPQIKNRVFQCPHCQHERHQPVSETSADPFHCPLCNP